MNLTQDQINSFNEYQASGVFHPFTCIHAHDGGADLIAKTDGLYCPNCDYRQDWAHEWMLDGSWRKAQVFGQ